MSELRPVQSFFIDEEYDLAGWLSDALECAGIQAATEVDDALIGDIENWQPIGILAALEE